MSCLCFVLHAMFCRWGDQFVSVEHLVLALAEDSRYVEGLMKEDGLTKDKLDQVGGRNQRWKA